MVVDDVEPDPVTSMSPSHVEMTELAEIAKGHVASLVNRVAKEAPRHLGTVRPRIRTYANVVAYMYV